MKRKNNLYDNMYKLENIESVFNEICRNTKNKKRVERYKEFKCANIYDVYNTLNKKKVVVFEHTATERSTIDGEKSQMLATMQLFGFFILPLLFAIY